MGLEAGLYINSLIATNPVNLDGVSEGDDHFRLVKGCLLNSFPEITGAVTAGQSELNRIGSINDSFAPSLANNDASFIVGNPGAIHISMGAGHIQAKNGMSTPAALYLNRLGGQVNIGYDGASGSNEVRIYGYGRIGYRTGPNGPMFRGSSNVDPATGGGNSSWIELQDADGTLVGTLGFLGGPGLYVQNRTWGGFVHLSAAGPSAGVDTIGISASAERQYLRSNGILVAETLNTGVNTGWNVRGSVTGDPGLGEAQNPEYRMTDALERIVSRWYFGNSDNMSIENRVYSGALTLRATSSAGDSNIVFQAFPDNISMMCYAGFGTSRALSTGVGAFWNQSPGLGSNQTVDVGLFQSDFIRLARFGFVASKDLEIANLNHGGNVIIKAENNGGTTQTLASFDPDTGLATFHAYFQSGPSLQMVHTSGGLTIKAPTDVAQSLAIGNAVVGGLWVVVDDATGRARLSQLAPNFTLQKDWIRMVRDGGIELLFNGSSKAQVVNGGLDVTGVLDATADVMINGESVIREATGSTLGMVEIAGEPEVKAGTGFGALTPAVMAAAGVFGVAGKYLLPGGLLLQWGQQAHSTGAGTSVDYTITFPTAYTTLYHVWVSTEAVDAIVGGEWECVTSTFQHTNTNFKFRFNKLQTGGDYVGHWLAIGKVV